MKTPVLGSQTQTRVSCWFRLSSFDAEPPLQTGTSWDWQTTPSPGDGSAPELAQADVSIIIKMHPATGMRNRQRSIGSYYQERRPIDPFASPLACQEIDARQPVRRQRSVTTGTTAGQSRPAIHQWLLPQILQGAHRGAAFERDPCGRSR